MDLIAVDGMGWKESLFARLLKCGTIPKHVAFIMDGNRRFARKNNLRSTKEGHLHGYRKLIQTIEWCKGIGIQEVTVYAFSIDNLERPDEEVTGIFDLFQRKCEKLIENSNDPRRKVGRIRFIGNKSYFSPEMFKLAAKIELMTKDNPGFTVNAAFYYKAQDEITHTINRLAAGVRDGSLSKADVNMTLFNQCLYTRDSPPPEVIVRTSGETRLSDFLLCQGAWSYLHFTDVLWPELTAWDILWAIFRYQVHADAMRNTWERYLTNEPLTPNALKFIENIDKEHVDSLQRAVDS